MKPYQILVFFVSVILLLFAISLIFPKEGIKVSDNIELSFFKPGVLFEEDTVEYADISGLLERVNPKESLNNEIEIMVEIDSLQPIDTIRANADSLKQITHLIEFPEDQHNRFHSFFQKAEKLKTEGQLLRILHYGDSQIETDRITGYIRNKLQRNFGGSGCGLVPAVPLYNGKASVRQKSSANWVRKTGFANRDILINHNKYGPLFAFTLLEKYPGDSIYTGWLEFAPSPVSYSLTRYFQNLKLYLGKPDSSELLIELYVNDSLYDSRRVYHSSAYFSAGYELKTAPEKIHFTFRSASPVTVYGVSLDNHSGLAVDNIPLRGSAGLVFSKTDTSLLAKVYRDLNIGLMILQFGGNVVPYMKNSEQYERYFSRELRVIRSILPGVPVLVVGPSDMSVRENGKYQTYPYLENVRDALRQSAHENGYAFWDMYEAMGGRNSMPSWVFADPPLAISDFVHFNHRGATLIAEMLYNSIIYEYKIWQKVSKTRANSSELIENSDNGNPEIQE